MYTSPIELAWRRPARSISASRLGGGLSRSQVTYPGSSSINFNPAFRKIPISQAAFTSDFIWIARDAPVTRLAKFEVARFKKRTFWPSEDLSSRQSTHCVPASKLNTEVDI